MANFFNFLSSVFKKKHIPKDPHRDENGHIIQNRRGVDTKPNEPYDSVAPPIRYESSDEIKKAKEANEAWRIQ